MPGDITLPDKNNIIYKVTREKPSSAHISLGVKSSLTGNQDAERDVMKGQSELFSPQIRATKCDKTSYLNSFKTGCMHSLVYPLLAT